MEYVRGPGEWIASSVQELTQDERLRSIYRSILVRTIGTAADDLYFPYDRYSAPDGLGRPEKAQLIGQWLCMESRTNPDALYEKGLSDFLAEATLDELWTHAKERLSQSGYDGRLPFLEGDEETLVQYDDGHRIVAILRPEAVRNEYHASGMPGSAIEGMSTWVLRDREDVSVAMLVFRGNMAVAMYGPGRSRVPFHISEAYLLGPLTEAGFSLDEPTVVHGGVMTSDGHIHDLRDLPEGSTVDGSLWIRDEGRLLSRLPEGLTVNGDLGIFNSAYMLATPKNLKVTGNCGFVNCPGLRKVSSGLSVGGYTRLETCSNLTKIEDAVDFGRAVMLSAEISKLDARPFRAGEIVVRGEGVNACLKGTELPRNREGSVVINEAFVKKTVKQELLKDVAQLPLLAARVGYDQLKSRIRKGIRELRRPDNRRKPEDDGSGPSVPPGAAR